MNKEKLELIHTDEKIRVYQRNRWLFWIQCYGGEFGTDEDLAHYICILSPRIGKEFRAVFILDKGTVYYNLGGGAFDNELLEVYKERAADFMETVRQAKEIIYDTFKVEIK
ncbi:MAG: hypothetical protein IJF87_11110 [Erysipelotrichaceae bacterium]|nr:hypothetical protein [Erysipelotrichaceae bacterium]